MHGRALILGGGLYLTLFVAVAAGWQGPDRESDELGEHLQRLIALQMVLLAVWHVVRGSSIGLGGGARNEQA